MALLGFDSIATKIENPYGSGFNDIPLDAIVQRSKDIIQDCMGVQSYTTKGQVAKEHTSSSILEQENLHRMGHG